MIYAMAVMLWILVAGVLSERPNGPWVRKYIGRKLRPWLAVLWPLIPLFVLYSIGRRLAK